MNYHTPKTPLCAKVEAHLQRTGIRPTVFGRAVLRDPRLVSDLRAGRQPRPATTARILAGLEAAA